MITELAIRVGEAWALAAGLQLVLWVVAQRTRNAGIVDVGWAGSFSLMVALFAWRATAPLTTWLPIAIVVVLWSLRLTGYLILRGAASPPEEGRYKKLRDKWGIHASKHFFGFFQAQALMAGVLSSAVVVPFVGSPWDSGWLRVIGIAISGIGIVGEATADWQLRRFKQRDKSGVCDVGLWSWSRHPNYFFEWCVWLGYAIHGLAFWPYGAIAIVPQAIIFASIWFVTGISPTENQAMRSKGDAYRAYQARVAKFFPWPPKRS